MGCSPCCSCLVMSDAPVVGAPVLDALLDLFASEVLLEGLFSESNDFVVGSKAESNQLIFRELVDLGVPLGGGEGLETKALFQTNDAVLHLERVGADAEHGDEDCDGKEDEPLGIDSPVTEAGAVKLVGEFDCNDQVDDEDRRQNHVVRRVKTGMLLEALWGLIAHGFPSFLRPMFADLIGTRSGGAECSSAGDLKTTLGAIVRVRQGGCQLTQVKVN